MAIRHKPYIVAVFLNYDYGIITDMEQTPSLPNHSPELPSVSPSTNKESLGTISSPETVGGAAVERKELHSEAAPPPAQGTIPPLVVPVPTAVPLPSDDSVSSTVAADDLPTVANDDELIEKEWVDKAKKVIAETKDDPYRREQEVSRLQVDYLAKRYGRELGGLRSDG